MSVGIYGLYFNEECLYVGQSKDIEQRYKRHLSRLKSGRALKNFNEWFEENNRPHDSIELKILEECEDDDFVKNSLEIKWFRELKPLFYGKEPSLNDTWNHSEGTRKKISESLKTRLGIVRAEERLCRKCNTIIVFGRRVLCDNCYSKNSSKHIGEIRPCVRCGTEFITQKEYSKFCSRNCFDSHKRENNSERDSKILELRASGMSLREISKIVGTSHVTVKVVLDYNNPL